MKKLADALVLLSLVALILSAVGAFAVDVWLASTQWVLVAIALAIYGLYLRERE